MDFKFIHAADIHLDSPLVGLERYPGAPVEYIRGATRKAFQNLVELALEEQVGFVLLAGDLYDGDWRDYNTGLFFVSQVARLRDAGIHVYLIRGNHDAASQITRLLHLPDHVRDFSTAAPETIFLEDLGVAIHGQGFPTPAVTEDLSRRYPDPVKDYFNLGLLHTCATGRQGHENYAPCDTGYLKNKGYDYWALGHVHRQEVIGKDPWIVFPGNIQGRHIRETGAKGCALVQVQDGRVTGVQHCALDVLRWSLCRVDATGAASYDEVLEKAEQQIEIELHQNAGRFLALRVEVMGACAAHDQLICDQPRLHNDLRSLAVERGQDTIWIEKVKLRTSPLGELDEILSSSPIAYLRQYLRELGADEENLLELSAALARDRQALPPDLFQEGEMDPGDIASLQELLSQVEDLLLSRLLGKEGAGR